MQNKKLWQNIGKNLKKRKTFIINITFQFYYIKHLILITKNIYLMI